jgi:hypothetical protein
MKLSCLIDVTANQSAKSGTFCFPKKIGFMGG